MYEFCHKSKHYYKKTLLNVAFFCQIGVFAAVFLYDF